MSNPSRSIIRSWAGKAEQLREHETLLRNNKCNPKTGIGFSRWDLFFQGQAGEKIWDYGSCNQGCSSVCGVNRNYSIVSNIAGGGAEVDDGSSSGAAVCECVDVGHDIVPELALLFGRHGEVDVLFMAHHLLNLFVCDGQTQSLRRTHIILKTIWNMCFRFSVISEIMNYFFSQFSDIL